MLGDTDLATVGGGASRVHHRDATEIIAALVAWRKVRRRRY
jgi:hypothetical protein